MQGLRIMVVLLAIGVLMPAQQQAPKIRETGESFYYASLAVTGPYSQMPTKVTELMTEVGKQGLETTYPMAFYFNSPDQVPPEELSWALAVQVPESTEVKPPLELGRFHYDKVAEILWRGPYTALGQAYNVLMPFIAKQGFSVCGPVCETYLDDPSSVAPEQCRTLIVAPVHKP